MSHIDLTGQVINGVRVLHPDFSRKSPKSKYWVCLCPCGEQFSTRSYDLNVKKMSCKECNKKRREEKGFQAMIDIAGQTFGNLHVIKKDLSCDVRGNQTGTFWICKCICGEVCSRRGVDLRKGNVRSCGCLRRETKGKARNGYVHGASKQPWYSNWSAMVYRTTNTKSQAYDRYEKVIEIGEKIDPSFISDPWAFYEEIGEKPGKDYSIDRINNSMGYVKGNIRWADSKTQMMNRNIVKRTHAENKILELAKYAKSKEEFQKIITEQLTDDFFREVSLP